MPKGFTTIALEDDVLKMIKEMDISHHGIEMKSNSDKMKAIILAYRDDLKNI